jgi:UDP-2,3-diacylglucosamine pyrophosphatase LpxH
VLRLAPLLVCAALVSAQGIPTTRTLRGGVEAPAPARAIVVIGDLHMGPGRQAGGQWHPYEDFRWRDEFIAFLDALPAQGGNIDLVINGDLFELLQSSAVPCNSSGMTGCTAAEAVQRLDTVVKAHADELAAIGKLAAARSNRVFIIPGDHDAALLLPEVWRRAAAAFAAPADRVTLVSSGTLLLADDRIHIEHGHQLPTSANRFSNWPTPVITVNGRPQIERPWGEQVILPFYNRTESKYPIVDNIAEEGVGAKFVAAADPTSAQDLPALLRFFLTKTTWQQFRMDLDDGEVQAPAWDLRRIRADPGAFMAASLPSDDPFAATVKTIAPANLAETGAQLSDQEIVAICDYRAAVRRARRRMERVLTQLSGVGAPMPECPRTPDTVGSAFEYYWRSRDQQIVQHIPRAKALDLIVLGHTHLLDRPFRPLGENGPAVVTSGAWQRTIHPNDLKAIDAPLESLPACYSFVEIPAGGRRTAQPHSWRPNDQKQWTMSNGGC